MSDKKKGKKPFDILMDDLSDAMKDYKKEDVYLSSDVDARIKFYNENICYSLGFDEDNDDSPVEWLLKLFHESKQLMFNPWLFVFCFGDMNEDFERKVEELKK